MKVYTLDLKHHLVAKATWAIEVHKLICSTAAGKITAEKSAKLRIEHTFRSSFFSFFQVFEAYKAYKPLTVTKFDLDWPCSYGPASHTTTE